MYEKGAGGGATCSQYTQTEGAGLNDGGGAKRAARKKKERKKMTRNNYRVFLSYSLFLTGGYVHAVNMKCCLSVCLSFLSIG